MQLTRRNTGTYSVISFHGPDWEKEAEQDQAVHLEPEVCQWKDGVGVPDFSLWLPPASEGMGFNAEAWAQSLEFWHLAGCQGGHSSSTYLPACVGGYSRWGCSCLEPCELDLHLGHNEEELMFPVKLAHWPQHKCPFHGTNLLNPAAWQRLGFSQGLL